MRGGLSICKKHSIVICIVSSLNPIRITNRHQYTPLERPVVRADTGEGQKANGGHNVKPDISTLPKTGHFYFALTSIST